MFFNTYFFDHLTSDPVTGKFGGGSSQKGWNYEKVKKWTKNVDIFAKEFIIVPINENMHWYLAVIINPGALLNEEKVEVNDVESSSRSGDAGDGEEEEDIDGASSLPEKTPNEKERYHGNHVNVEPTERRRIRSGECKDTAHLISSDVDERADDMDVDELPPSNNPENYEFTDIDVDDGNPLRAPSYPTLSSAIENVDDSIIFGGQVGGGSFPGPDFVICPNEVSAKDCRSGRDSGSADSKFDDPIVLSDTDDDHTKSVSRNKYMIILTDSDDGSVTSVSDCRRGRDVRSAGSKVDDPIVLSDTDDDHTESEPPKEKKKTPAQSKRAENDEKKRKELKNQKQRFEDRKNKLVEFLTAANYTC